MATPEKPEKRNDKDKAQQVEPTRTAQATQQKSSQALEPRRERGLSSGSFGPFGMMRRLFQDLERLSGFGWPSFPSMFGSELDDMTTQSYVPQFDVVRRGDKLVVRADLPGLAPDDIDITLRDDMLIVSGERRDEREYERGDVWRSERSYGRFERAIAVPEGVDANNCQARFENGVLEIELKAPQEQPPKGKKIEIKSGAQAQATKH